jgi:hypothetical protein
VVARTLASVEIVANTPPPNRPPVAVAGGSSASGNAPLVDALRGGLVGSRRRSAGLRVGVRRRAERRGRERRATCANPGTYAVLTVTDGRGGQDGVGRDRGEHAAAEPAAGGGGGRLAGERERAARRDVLGGGLVRIPTAIR